jgi:hypothetical protein
MEKAIRSRYTSNIRHGSEYGARIHRRWLYGKAKPSKAALLERSTRSEVYCRYLASCILIILLPLLIVKTSILMLRVPRFILLVDEPGVKNSYPQDPA